ncbi:redoxin domain-containing protein [Nocardioides sp. HDW12B]|uniref:winged helix-turn-helix transcriptional regulator n=1 Tax=Nocardioides sp. HDW12B TaxID=2714939 RepID=UPI00140D2640|nr:winged helix-turn-helix transcriptional regulator [Nocardioides sp. HDW12B]QIK67985.1 redoxin domain-containing protein [Nocardioides sp. HDW12B]
MRREDLADADCGIAQALGVVGDWWTVLVLREVAGGVTRFDGLQGALGVSRRTLTEKLAGLVDHGVLERRAYSTRPPRHDYVLTPRGEGLLPVLVALQEFGDRHLLGDGSLTATAASTSAESARVHALVGRTVPSTVLTGADGGAHDVRREEGWRVVFCFPGAFAPGAADGPGPYPPGWGDIPGTRGCTLEVTTYAAAYDRFLAAGADVVGVSSQRPDELRAFGDHVGAPFPLLSDDDLRLASTLRLPVFRSAGQERYKRQTLLLDPAGVVRAAQMPITDPAGSVAEMLAELTRLT